MGLSKKSLTHRGGVPILTGRGCTSACTVQKEGHDARCCEVPQWIHHPATWIIATIAVAGLLGRLIYWMGTVDTDRKNFRSFMEEVRADIKEILGRLPPVAVTSGSPLRLTDLGHKISEAIDAKALVDELASELAPLLRTRHAYEVQDGCIRFVLDEYKPPPEVAVRIMGAAFENGIDKEQVLRVLAVELRDRILADPDRPVPAPDRRTP